MKTTIVLISILTIIMTAETMIKPFEPIIIENTTLHTQITYTRVPQADAYAPIEEEVIQVPQEEEIVQEKPILSLEDKICDTFPDNCDLMIAIAKAESGLDPNTPPNGNNNGSTDTGIFRINSIHGYSQEYLTDVDNNIAVAREIFDTQGITAWVAYNNGTYKRHL